MSLFWTHWLLVGIGGALGSLGRFALQWRIQSAVAGYFPWGTLAVNLIGCALIGALAAFLETLPGSGAESRLRAFLAVGVLGGFTTFSSFSAESLALLRAGEWKSGLAYVLASNVLGILLAAGGFAAARFLLRPA
jgi:fluoride exporter